MHVNREFLALGSIYFTIFVFNYVVCFILLKEPAKRCEIAYRPNQTERRMRDCSIPLYNHRSLMRLYRLELKDANLHAMRATK